MVGLWVFTDNSLTLCIFDNFKNIRKNRKNIQKKRKPPKTELNSPEVDIYVYNNPES